MKVNITVARPDLIPDIWDVVFPMLKPVVDGDMFLNEEILKERLLQDKALLFIATIDGKMSGAIVVQVEDCANRLVWITALGGKNFKAWGKQFVSALEEYAKSLGSKYILGLGVKAWQRMSPDFSPVEKQLYLKEVHYGR